MEVWWAFSQLEVLSQVLLTWQVSAVAWKEPAKILIQTGTELVSRLAEPTGKGKRKSGQEGSARPEERWEDPDGTVAGPGTVSAASVGLPLPRLPQFTYNSTFSL